MPLISLLFAAFFALSLIIYYVIPRKFQWLALLLFSLVFFVLSSPPYTLLYLAISIISTTLCTRWISQGRAEHNRRKAKAALILGIVINLGILVVLKYNGFVINNVNRIFLWTRVSIELPSLDLAAPIGISFYTLTVVGCLLDTYWGVIAPQSDLLKTALFVGYYPQLTSGPIARYGQVGDQFSQGHKFDYEAVTLGLQRMLWGVFKKLVISVRLGIVVDTVYGDTQLHPGLYIWLAAALFMIQLYTDFSGCMDIILGASECYGIILPENFRTPFFSRSVQEFWQRWHITLGVWMRDYVLYPVLRTRAWSKMAKWTKAHLGKKAVKQLPSYLGMLCVWLLMGLWHGGSWKYILGVGLWFWAMIVLSQILEPVFKKIIGILKINTGCFGWRLFQSLRVFMLVCIGNMFFRLDSLTATLRVMKAGLRWNPWIFSDGFLSHLGLSRANFLVIALGLGILMLVSALEERGINVRRWLAEQKLALRWTVYFSLIFSILLLSPNMTVGVGEFMYAQF